jgi:hypothetical protein
MAEHPNVAIVRNAYESFAKGDLDGALADLADDCVFHFGGDGPNSGDHKGREAITAALIKNFELTAGTQALDIKGIRRRRPRRRGPPRDGQPSRRRVDRGGRGARPPTS